MFDTFVSPKENGAFAVVNIKNKLDVNKFAEREVSSNYLYSLLARNFLSVVRIMAIVILARRIFKKKGRICKNLITIRLNFSPLRGLRKLLIS